MPKRLGANVLPEPCPYTRSLYAALADVLIEQISTRHERHVRGKAESFHRYVLGEIDGTLAQRPPLSLL